MNLDSIILMTVFNISCYIITLFKFTCIKDISKSVIYSLHEGRFVFYCGKKNHIIWHLNTKTNLSASYIVKYKHDAQQISRTSPSYHWNSIPCKQQLSIFPLLSTWQLPLYFLKVKFTQLCPTLCEPMDSLVDGIVQARILERVAFPFSRGSFQARDGTRVSCIAGDSLPSEPPGKPKNTGVGSLSLLQGIFLTQELNWGLLHCREFFTS